MTRYVLKDLIELSKDGDWGKSEPFHDSVEMLCVRGTDFVAARSGMLDSIPRRFIAKKIAAYKTLKAWDVLIETAGGTKGQITGRTLPIRPRLLAQAELPLTCASFSRFMRFRADICEAEFMFWYLQHLYAAGFMNAYHTQHTGVARFQWTTFAKTEPLNLPSLPVQRRIAEILSAYDELIENHRRRIQLLERIARAVYREWLVDFRVPGHDRVPRIASATGPPIPAGWELRTLGSLVADHIGGGWGQEFQDDKHAQAAWVIRGTDIPSARRCQVVAVPRRYHTDSNLRSRRLSPGDIVFEVSGGSKGQPVGRTLLVTPMLLSAFGGEPVMCASFCKRLTPDAAAYGSELLYLSFLEGYDSGEIERFQVQSTGISNFKWTEYLQQTVRAVPPPTLRMRLREIVAPQLAQIALLGLQAENLRRTRDLLLPRLLAGQVVPTDAVA